MNSRYGNNISVKDETGVPIAMVGIIRDITERKKVEKALLESGETLPDLFESATDAILFWRLRRREGRSGSGSQSKAPAKCMDIR